MLKLRFLGLLIIVSLFLSGCFIQFGDESPFFVDDRPSLKVVNRYHQPIDVVTVYEATDGGPSIYYHYIELNITKGKSDTFKLDYTSSLDAYTKVSYGSEYDVKIVRLTVGNTTTVTLNENGILE